MSEVGPRVLGRVKGILSHFQRVSKGLCVIEISLFIIVGFLTFGTAGLSVAKNTFMRSELADLQLLRIICVRVQGSSQVLFVHHQLRSYGVTTLNCGVDATRRDRLSRVTAFLFLVSARGEA